MGLKTKLTSGEALRAWSGAIPVAFRYTAGVAGERFFDVLRRRGRLSVTRCPECGTTYLPPRLYCRQCFVDLSAHWDEVPPRGTVHTFTVVRRDRRGRTLPQPQVVGVVAIDGTDGSLLVPLAGPPEAVRIGQRVEAVLRPARERRGTIRDIVHFR